MVETNEIVISIQSEEVGRAVIPNTQPDTPEEDQYLQAMLRI